MAKRIEIATLPEKKVCKTCGGKSQVAVGIQGRLFCYECSVKAIEGLPELENAPRPEKRCYKCGARLTSVYETDMCLSCHNAEVMM